MTIRIAPLARHTVHFSKIAKTPPVQKHTPSENPELDRFLLQVKTIPPISQRIEQYAIQDNIPTILRYTKEDWEALNDKIFGLEAESKNNLFKVCKKSKNRKD